MPELEVTNANGCSHLPTLDAVYKIIRVENMNFNCKKFFGNSNFLQHLCTAFMQKAPNCRFSATLCHFYDDEPDQVLCNRCV